jgi:hypothetical protein
MLFALFSLVAFGLVYYFLWTLWCHNAPTLLAPDAPQWAKRPNFFVFVLVTLIILSIYRNLTRR